MDTVGPAAIKLTFPGMRLTTAELQYQKTVVIVYDVFLLFPPIVNSVHFALQISLK